MIESIGKQKAVVRTAGKHIVRMRQIAHVSGAVLGIKVNTLAAANVVSTELRICPALDFEHIPGNVLLILLYEFQHIVTINRRAAIKSEVIRERTRAPQIAPLGDLKSGIHLQMKKPASRQAFTIPLCYCVPLAGAAAGGTSVPSTFRSIFTSLPTTTPPPS